MDVCAGFELIAIENATTRGDDVLEIGKGRNTQMICPMRHGSPPRLMAPQFIPSADRREASPTSSPGNRMTHTALSHEGLKVYGSSSCGSPFVNEPTQRLPQCPVHRKEAMLMFVSIFSEDPMGAIGSLLLSGRVRGLNHPRGSDHASPLPSTSRTHGYPH
jgi:hypothetical protein